MLPLYYYTGSGLDYLIGVPEITEILIPTTFEPCARTALFETLNVTCMPAYQPLLTGRRLAGQLATYSLADGVSSLVYDLAAFDVSSSARLVAIEFNVFDRTQGNIAIARIMLERSSFGSFVSSSSVVTVPQHFVYFGGNGTSGEWALVVGQIFILVIASGLLLFLTIRGVKTRSTSVMEVAILTICIMCIVSFGIQVGTAASMPLMNVNLGTAKSVQLSAVAASFNTVNGINSVIIFFLSVLLLGQVVKVGYFGVSSVTALLLCMVMIAYILSVQFGHVFSYGESFMLLVRIAMRRVSSAEFDTISSLGFSLIAILVLHSLVVYIVTGLTIASFLPSVAISSISNNPTRGRKATSDERPESPLLEPSSPISTPENLGDHLIGSVEVLAGRALTQISQLRERMDLDLETAREELERSQIKISSIKSLIHPG